MLGVVEEESADADDVQEIYTSTCHLSFIVDDMEEKLRELDVVISQNMEFAETIRNIRPAIRAVVARQAPKRIG